MIGNYPSGITLFLCGDVMAGRGIDQILPSPGNPRLYESYIHDARDYVALAEQVSGAIPRHVDFSYPWGEALDEINRLHPDVRIINLETSITTSDDYWREKPVLYRMHPANIGCLTAARIDCCSLANNHVLDWGYAGLAETLATLDQANLAHVGAGANAGSAAAPAIFEVAGKGRVRVFAFGSETSGVPYSWQADIERPGVNLLADLSRHTARQIAAELARTSRPGDVTVASIHWGSNWGFDVSEEQIQFAHSLIDEGVSLVHGHSSHHVRPFEIYNGKLILYGCGDFMTDYEGIGGYEAFRGDLALAYFPIIDAGSGKLLNLRMVPMRQRRFRLQRAPQADAHWLVQMLNTLGESFQTHVRMEQDGSLNLASLT